MTKQVSAFAIALLILMLPHVLHSQNNGCHNEGSFIMCTNYVVSGLNGATGPSLTFGDNTTNTVNNNAWHQILNQPANTQFVNFATGYDSSATVRSLAVDTNHHVWEYKDNYNTGSNLNTWTEQTAMGTSAVKIIMGNAIYSLQNDGQCSTISGIGPRYHVFKWSGSAWVITGMGCVFDFAASNTGDNGVVETYLCTIGGGNASCLQTSTQNGHWYGISGGGWLHVSMQNASTIVVHDRVNSAVYYLNFSNPNNPTDTKLGTLSTNLPPSIDPDGKIWAVDTGGYANIWNGSSWTQILGNEITYINSFGTHKTYVVSTPSNVVFRYPDTSMTVSLQVTGNTTCSPSCPGPTTHQGTSCAGFAKHSLSGGGSCITGAKVFPTAAIDTGIVTDTSFDLFDCMDDQGDCLTTNSGGGVFCSAIGPIFNGPFIMPNFCFIQENFWSKWDSGTTVTVYFDQSVFSGATGKSYALDFFSGMSSWVRFRGVNYSFGGQVAIGGSCGSTITTWGRTVGLPCNPTFPYIVVTASAPGDNVSYSEPVQIVSPGSTHKFSVTTFGQSLFSSNSNHRMSRGAHEEGHRLGMGDCGISPGDCGSLTASGTVMWEYDDPNLPTLPTFCDQLWAAIDDIL